MTRSDEIRLKEYLAQRKALVDAALDGLLPGEELYPPLIFQAARYSLMAGGKRLRPILCLAAAEAVGGRAEAVMPVACALEFIHTYSLIH
ncbi:MAG: polyprenyl synthetase family protein, partial [Deltaproteobacteria bacterium]|nr:polyprenyl synthetase family protein [Deltaproteobacteria bacterium]